MIIYIQAMRLPFLTGSLIPILLAAGQAGGNSFSMSLELFLIGTGSLHQPIWFLGF